MLVQVPALLDTTQLAAMRTRLDAATWGDGRTTAGEQSARVKYNLQLAPDGTEARELGAQIVKALEGSPLFISAALPRYVFPPLFNRYEGGMAFGAHIDNAMRQIPGTARRLRTDLAATLFLSTPAEYEGGELMVEDTFGAHAVKLEAGSLVLYPASSVHGVRAVTRGCRIAAFFWVQSMVRDDGARTLLYDLDRSIRDLTQQQVQEASLVRLTGCYHNLLRRWAEL